MPRRLLIIAGAVALAAVVAIGLSQTRSESGSPRAASTSLPDALRALEGSPPRLAALHRQANQLLDGTPATVQQRIASLKGFPVVVNKWASWCGPCRYEFPFYQRLGVQFGKQVAFLGLNSGDNTQDAKAFLKQYPVTYPSYEDPNERTAYKLGASANYPITVFYTADGKQNYVHQGTYATQAKLAEDIKRYALEQR